MMSAAPAVCLFILICALTSGYGRILRFNSSPIKSSSLSATKTVCSDCTRITELVSNMIFHPEAQLQVSPQCTFCLFLIKKLEDMLPKERTEESVVKIMEKICDHLPDHYKEQCNELLEKYGKEIIDFLLTSATPQTICMLLHMCLVQDAPVQVPALASECKTCKLLMILSHIHLSQNSTETQMTALLWRTCHLHPNALPGCESFVQSHVPTLVNILSKEEEAVNACQMIFCEGRK